MIIMHYHVLIILSFLLAIFIKPSIHHDISCNLSHYHVFLMIKLKHNGTHKTPHIVVKHRQLILVRINNDIRQSLNSTHNLTSLEDYYSVWKLHSLIIYLYVYIRFSFFLILFEMTKPCIQKNCTYE